MLLPYFHWNLRSWLILASKKTFTLNASPFVLEVANDGCGSRDQNVYHFGERLHFNAKGMTYFFGGEGFFVNRLFETVCKVFMRIMNGLFELLERDFGSFHQLSENISVKYVCDQRQRGFSLKKSMGIWVGISHQCHPTHWGNFGLVRGLLTTMIP